MNDGPAVRRRFDIMPDGSGLLGLVSSLDGGATSRTVNIVTNWFEELKPNARSSVTLNLLM